MVNKYLHQIELGLQGQCETCRWEKRSNWEKLERDQKNLSPRDWDVTPHRQQATY